MASLNVRDGDSVYIVHTDHESEADGRLYEVGDRIQLIGPPEPRTFGGDLQPYTAMHAVARSRSPVGPAVYTKAPRYNAFVYIKDSIIVDVLSIFGAAFRVEDVGRMALTLAVHHGIPLSARSGAVKAHASRDGYGGWHSLRRFHSLVDCHAVRSQVQLINSR